MKFKYSETLLCNGSQKMFCWPKEKGYADMQIFDSCRPEVFQVESIVDKPADAPPKKTCAFCW